MLSAFREAAFTKKTLTEFVVTVDECVIRYVGEEDFASAVLLELSDHEVKLVNLGHPSPLRLAPSPEVESYAVVSGERILLYTDGVSE